LYIALLKVSLRVNANAFCALILYNWLQWSALIMCLCSCVMKCSDTLMTRLINK